MKTDRIIEVFKMQGLAMNDAPCKELWFDTMKVRLNREHLIQVIKDRGVWDNIIPSKNLDTFLGHNSWSDLVTTLNKHLLDKETATMGI